MDIILSFLAKPVDKYGITLLRITYPPLNYQCELVSEEVKKTTEPTKQYKYIRTDEFFLDKNGPPSFARHQALFRFTGCLTLLETFITWN